MGLGTLYHLKPIGASATLLGPNWKFAKKKQHSVNDENVSQQTEESFISNCKQLTDDIFFTAYLLSKHYGIWITRPAGFPYKYDLSSTLPAWLEVIMTVFPISQVQCGLLSCRRQCRLALSRRTQRLHLSHTTHHWIHQSNLYKKLGHSHWE